MMPFAATRMNLEIIILSKSDTERQTPCDITYMWSLKYDTNELTYETQSGTQPPGTRWQVPRRRGGWEGRTGSLGLADAD